MAATATAMSIRSGATVAVIGLESSGKSALFRTLTGRATGDEANFRGSTVRCRNGRIPDSSLHIVDTPGIRVSQDTETTRLALEQLSAVDAVVLVVRGTHVQNELTTVLRALGRELQGRKLALAITFADKASPEIEQLVTFYRRELDIPVIALDARHVRRQKRAALLEIVARCRPLRAGYSLTLAPPVPIVEPLATVYEHSFLGPLAAILSIGLMFGFPVLIAYHLSQWLQPIVESRFITPIIHTVGAALGSSEIGKALLIGDYGLITLGWYSFLWAFPVVLFISAAVAVTEETGLKDRITAALDPVLRLVGLSGRDLIPVLTGFGCNVVAVFQSRACSLCHRKNCVSMIAFGSACSYQIGASLSLFGSAGRPWLFFPYVFVLFVVGAIHTRIWSPPISGPSASLMIERAFLQQPNLKAIGWRVRATLKQFLFQAMPVFLAICIIGTVLNYFHLTDVIAASVGTLIEGLNLPRSLAPGIVLSMIRKDGLLVLNKGDGALLQPLDGGQLFLLVFLASTLTACLVTLFTISKELGLRFAATLAVRQAGTSLLTAIAISIVWRIKDFS